MIVLGIDPGSQCLGYGLLRSDRLGHHVYLSSGYLKLKGSLSERLLQIEQGLTTIMDRHQPECVAIESIFVHRFPKSALVLGHARGAAMLTVARRSIPLAEYPARLVKKTLVGYGNAAKDQMQHMVKQLFHLNGLPQSDAADALAVAFCHIAHGMPVSN